MTHATFANHSVSKGCLLRAWQVHLQQCDIPSFHKRQLPYHLNKEGKRSDDDGDDDDGDDELP